MNEKLRHPTSIIHKSGASNTTVALVAAGSAVTGFAVGLFLGFTIFDELVDADRRRREQEREEHRQEH